MQLKLTPTQKLKQRIERLEKLIVAERLESSRIMFKTKEPYDNLIHPLAKNIVITREMLSYVDSPYLTMLRKITEEIIKKKHL
jgi:hypothetical protein